MFKRQFFPLLCILITAFTADPSAAPAQDRPAMLFDQGNSTYQQGDYAAAEKSYLQILDAGFESGPLYFNLGNACFKQKKLGEAVFYWEKAKQKMPLDREVEENLELASLLLVDQIEITEDPFPVRVMKSIRDLLTIPQESRLALVFFLASNILFFLYISLKNPRHAFRALIGSFAIAGVTLLFALSLAWKIYDRDFLPQGIVLKQRVDVLSGPGVENITVFTIHEGIKVRIHESASGWHQISLPNGWNGWLPQDAVGVL